MNAGKGIPNCGRSLHPAPCSLHLCTEISVDRLKQALISILFPQPPRVGSRMQERARLRSILVAQPSGADRCSRAFHPALSCGVTTRGREVRHSIKPQSKPKAELPADTLALLRVAAKQSTRSQGAHRAQASRMFHKGCMHPFTDVDLPANPQGQTPPGPWRCPHALR